MKKALLLFFILAVSFANSSSQAKQENRIKFVQAEVFVLYEDYNEALPLYQELLKVEPDNFNYKYRIGQCLINITGRKGEAISFLEDAVKNINLKYKEGRFKETKAPYDAYYYLANAYRINNQLTKALSTYELFKQNLDPQVYDTAVVNLQIVSCLNAQKLMKLPSYIKKENLGDLINDKYSESNPVISGDESVLVYNRAAPLQDFVLFSKKVNGKWTPPVDIIPDFGIGNEEKNFASSLSQDGRELYIYRPGNDFDGNIYMSRRDANDRWSNLVKLNDNINTKYWESHATISHDGKKLYFTSNREGSYGGLDIYVSERDSTGDWGPAKNMGPVINTEYNEENPFLGKDDKTLFFSSRGHFNIGGYDIFYSTLLDNGEWSVPLNLGYPINSTDDDVFFDPISDGYHAYYAIDDTGSYGLQDIYRIEIFSKDHPRKFFVKGIVQIKDLRNMFNDSIKISAFNFEDPNATAIVYSIPLTGEYKLELTQGKYSITYETDGAQKTTNKLDLPLSNPTDSFVLPATTLVKTDFIADMVVESNKTISVVRGDSISFPVKVEPKSVLIVEHWLGDSLFTSEKFIITDSSFVYKTIPRTGDNRIVFKLTDRFNNTTTSDIFVKREKMVTEQLVVRPEYRIRPEDLNKIAADVLSGIDTSISTVRNKILAYSDKNVNGSFLKQSVNTTDQKSIKNGGKWLQSVYNESLILNIKDPDLAGMLTALSSLPGTEVGKYLKELAAYSDDTLKKYLNSQDLKKAKIKTPDDLILNLLRNKDKGLFPVVSPFDALVKLTASKDVPTDTFAAKKVIPEGNNLWILWVVIGAGLITFYLIFSRRKKK